MQQQIEAQSRTNAVTAGKIALIVALTLAAGFAHATPIDKNTDTFWAFYNTLNTWLSSGLGVGLAIAALAVGAIMGVAKTSAMPALVGLGVAAVVAWGPGIILKIVTGGAVLI